MSKKNRNKKVRICLIVGTISFLLGLWAVLMMSETALAAKPGNIPVCIEFLPGGGIQSDDYDDDGIPDPYCDDKQLKVETIITPDGHFNLFPNTGRGERTLYVDIDFDPDSTGENIISTEGWRFNVGGWNDTFDMRAMEIGETRNDVNLMIYAEAPPNNENVVNWLLTFDPSRTRWGIDYSDSTYVTVARSSTDTWEVNVDNTDRAVLVIQTQVKNKSEFTRLEGLVGVPPFTATVLLVP
jgi:hypothetical protein